MKSLVARILLISIASLGTGLALAASAPKAQAVLYQEGEGVLTELGWKVSLTPQWTKQGELYSFSLRADIRVPASVGASQAESGKLEKGVWQVGVTAMETRLTLKLRSGKRLALRMVLQPFARPLFAHPSCAESGLKFTHKSRSPSSAFAGAYCLPGKALPILSFSMAEDASWNGGTFFELVGKGERDKLLDIENPKAGIVGSLSWADAQAPVEYEVSYAPPAPKRLLGSGRLDIGVSGMSIQNTRGGLSASSVTGLGLYGSLDTPSIWRLRAFTRVEYLLPLLSASADKQGFLALNGGLSTDFALGRLALSPLAGVAYSSVYANQIALDSVVQSPELGVELRYPGFRSEELALRAEYFPVSGEASGSQLRIQLTQPARLYGRSFFGRLSFFSSSLSYSTEADTVTEQSKALSLTVGLDL